MPLPTPSPAALDGLDTILHKLSQTDLSDALSFTHRDLRPRHFRGWIRSFQGTDSPDELRNILYYGFQPLYDSLADGEVLPEDRQEAVRALDALTSLGAQYLAGYYLGEPDAAGLKCGIADLEPAFDRLSRTHYWTKERNLDTRLFPHHVHAFLTSYLSAVQEERTVPPAYIIGSACGASEIAMALGGLLGTDVGFMRYSKRREDRRVYVIPEQEPALASGCAGAPVLAVEDCVCTGASLARIMARAVGAGASSVTGASVTYTDEMGPLLPALRHTAATDCFHLYEFAS